MVSLYRRRKLLPCCGFGAILSATVHCRALKVSHAGMLKAEVNRITVRAGCVSGSHARTIRLHACRPQSLPLPLTPPSCEEFDFFSPVRLPRWRVGTAFHAGSRIG